MTVPTHPLICPPCGEAAHPRPPRRWLAANGPRPRHSHADGEPLCPVVGPRGYEPAQPADASTGTEAVR
jgi:hypothetical protein